MRMVYTLTYLLFQPVYYYMRLANYTWSPRMDVSRDSFCYGTSIKFYLLPQIILGTLPVGNLVICFISVGMSGLDLFRYHYNQQFQYYGYGGQLPYTVALADSCLLPMACLMWESAESVSCWCVHNCSEEKIMLSRHTLNNGGQWLADTFFFPFSLQPDGLLWNIVDHESSQKVTIWENSAHGTKHWLVWQCSWFWSFVKICLRPGGHLCKKQEYTSFCLTVCFPGEPMVRHCSLVCFYHGLQSFR